MSNQQQQSDQRDTRKSKRQRKPNQYYTAGINQLKKITIKANNKKNKNQDCDNYSSGEERLNISSNYRNTQIYQQKYDYLNSWLSCILPNNRYIKVQIVFDSSTMQVAKFKDEPIKIEKESSILSSTLNIATKKNQSGVTLNLLSLFTQAIKDVQPSSPQKANTSYIIDQRIKYPPAKKISSVAPPLPPPKRQIQQDKDGKILSVQINRPQKIIKFNHSKMGEYEVPIDEEVTQINKKQEEIDQQEIQKIDHWKAVINANLQLIKSIDIYS